MARPKEFDVDVALDRATELFWTKGYESTSISDLEEHLGIGRQSLYSTFGDKHRLYISALDRYASRQPVHRAPLFREDAGLAEIRAFFDHTIEFLTATEPRRTCLLLNSLLEIGSQDKEVSRRCNSAQEHLAMGFRHALAGAARRGELKHVGDPRAAALFLVGQSYGLNVLSQNGASAKTLRRVAATALSALE